MNQEEIKSMVSDILKTKLGVSDKEIDFNSTLKDLGADSLDEVDIVYSVEEKFGIRIPDQYYAESKTINEICNAIENLINNKI